MEEIKTKPSNKLLRYMSFEKFADILCRNAIFIPRADLFDDEFEGCYPQLVYEISRGIEISSNGVSSNQGLIEYTKKIKESAFVSCWTLGGSENMALWKLYGGKNSVAIETTIEDFVFEVEKPVNKNALMIFIEKNFVKVDYIDHKSKSEDLAKELLDFPHAALTKKYHAYSYEQEIRFMMTHHDIPGLKEKLGSGINIAVNAQDLIKKIYISPLADAWFFDFVKIYLKKFKMSHLVQKSNMSISPIGGAFDS